MVSCCSASKTLFFIFSKHADMSCTFESPEFVTQFNGAAPTFGFNPGSGDLLGFPCSWAYKGKVCGVNSGKSFTPVFKTGTSQYTCSLSVGASATSILCPSLAHSAIPTGTHTLSYINIHNECDPPVSTTFYVGKSPTPTTDTVYSTVSTTFTRQPPYASTVTETYYSSTSTYTYSFGSSAAFSTTSTYFANYCKPTSSSSPPGSSSSPPQQSSSSRSSTTPAQPPPTSKSTNPVPPPVTSTLSSVTAPAPSSSSVNCPGSDQQLVYSHGEVFQVQCGIDRSGGDLSTGSPVYNVDLQQCIDTCATTPGCVDFSLSGSACYLKGSVNPVEYNSNVNGAILVGSYDSTTTRITGQPSGASATVAPAPTASGVQCPGANATTFKGSCGSSYVIECYWDRQSADSEYFNISFPQTQVLTGYSSRKPARCLHAGQLHQPL